jgi:hypothetical protein
MAVSLKQFSFSLRKLLAGDNAFCKIYETGMKLKKMMTRAPRGSRLRAE